MEKDFLLLNNVNVLFYYDSLGAIYDVPTTVRATHNNFQ